MEKEQRYYITECFDDAVRIGAKGYEGSEIISKRNLAERLKQICEANIRENKIATFEWR